MHVLSVPPRPIGGTSPRKCASRMRWRADRFTPCPRHGVKLPQQENGTVGQSFPVSLSFSVTLEQIRHVHCL